MMNSLVRKLYYTAFRPRRVAVLDYEIVPRPMYSPETKPHERLNEIIAANDAAYETLVEGAVKHLPRFAQFVVQPSGDPVPAWENGFFPAFDTVMAYTILEKYRPQRYVEIGSGNSTKLAYFCRKEEGLSFSITSFDPHPRREVKAIADTWMDCEIQAAPLDYFRNLQPNDVVFLDGSHVVHANSDVAWFFMEILPILPPGVIVHIHDIFLPYDYPQWVCDRLFSEQYMFAVCLLNSDRYKIISPNYYLLTKRIGRSAIEEIWKLPALTNVRKHGRSFWFRIG